MLGTWKRGDSRAPHKPLLILLVFSLYLKGASRLVPFSDVETDLAQLIREFGPPRKSVHPEYPFWWLQSDGIWEVPEASKCAVRKGHNDAKKSELIRNHAHGGLLDPYYQVVRSDPSLALQLALMLLEQHFPSSLHDEILSAVGLQDSDLFRRRPRDPGFRERVLRAYSYRCVFCGFDLRLDQLSIGLEAAHIRWHQAGGPDVESNGLALCVLHHRLFDLGAFSLDMNSGRMIVSERLHGSMGVDEWAFQFHGRMPGLPIREEYLPSREFLGWHHREVFRSPARKIESSSEV